jgi:hypothetical protein
MPQFVFSHADVLIADGRFHARLNRGEAWFSDDPVVAAYPHYFSRYPLVVQSTAGRMAPGLSLLSVPLPEPIASLPVVDDAEQAVAAFDAAESVRRGPGRPRKDAPRG